MPSDRRAASIASSAFLHRRGVRALRRADHRGRPGPRTVITYIAPIVAVALGVAVLGERPGTGAIAGLLLILAGSWLSTDGRLPPGPGAPR